MLDNKKISFEEFVSSAKNHIESDFYKIKESEFENKFLDLTKELLKSQGLEKWERFAILGACVSNVLVLFKLNFPKLIEPLLLYVNEKYELFLEEKETENDSSK